MRWSVSISNTSSHRSADIGRRSAVISRRSQSAGQSAVGSHQSAVAVGRTVDGRQTSVGGRSRQHSRQSAASVLSRTSSSRRQFQLVAQSTTNERRTPNPERRHPKAPTRRASRANRLQSSRAHLPEVRHFPLPGRHLPSLPWRRRRDETRCRRLGRWGWDEIVGRVRETSIERTGFSAAIVRRRAALVDQRYRSRPLPSGHPPRRALPHRRQARERAGWGKCFAPTT